MSPSELGKDRSTGRRPTALSFDQLQAGVRAAEAALRLGHYRSALDSYCVLLRSRLAVAGGVDGFGAAELVIIERLSELTSLFGMFETADDLLVTMVGLCRNARNDVAADYAQLKRVELALARGRMQQSFNLLGDLKERIGDVDEIDLSPRGLKHWEATIEWRHVEAADRSVLLTRIYLVMGQVLAGIGRYGDALTVLERGLAHAEEGAAPDLARRTAPHIGLARVAALLEYGDLDAAERTLASFITDAPDNLAPAIHTRQLELSGKLDMLRGRLGSAARNFEGVVRFCDQKGFGRAGAAAALNLAHALVLFNRVGEALWLAEKAGARAAMLGDRGLEMRAATVASLALARRRSPVMAASLALSVKDMVQGRQSRGSDIRRPARSPVLLPVSQADNFLSFFEDRALEFQWVLASDPEDAKARLGLMKDTFSSTDSRLIHIQLGVLDGYLALVHRDFAAAESYFGRAAERLSALSLKPELCQVQHLRAHCLTQLGKLSEAARLAESAERLLLDISGSLVGGDRDTYLLNKATMEEAYIASQIEELVREEAQSAQASYLGRLRHRIRTARRLHRLMEHIDAYKLGRAGRQLAAETEVPLQDRRPSMLRRLLVSQRDRALLSYLVLPDRVFVMWSGFMTIGFAVSPVTRIDLRERVRNWHQRMRGERVGPRRDIGMADDDPLVEEPSDEQLIGDLGEALQLDTALAALPKRVSGLVVIPDDALHGVPFAALSHEGRYLVEKFALSIGYATWPSVKKRARRKLGLVVGVSKGFGRLQDLPQVPAESHAVADRLGSWGLEIRPFIDDEDASKASMLDVLQEAAIAHFACHGTFEPDQPDQSGLELMPRMGRDGRLTLHDLARVRLDNCQHVTLSSCWSADNFIIPGRWIVSLPETLWRSGAASTLGSLWPVDDDFAVAFVSRFYAEMKRLPRDAALREAQLASLSGELGRRGIPAIFWSGFRVCGEPGRLRL
ncbi:CHAT domain-containing protein [Mesorhizobium sp. M0644]|uniref:CHAT domain-containing protein n=1 Tax=Mesorhizobium sp. M0644 TaxID=2956979 RepID=UPI003339C5C1